MILEIVVVVIVVVVVEVVGGRGPVGAGAGDCYMFENIYVCVCIVWCCCLVFRARNVC